MVKNQCLIFELRIINFLLVSILETITNTSKYLTQTDPSEKKHKGEREWQRHETGKGWWWRVGEKRIQSLIIQRYWAAAEVWQWWPALVQQSHLLFTLLCFRVSLLLWLLQASPLQLHESERSSASAQSTLCAPFWDIKHCKIWVSKTLPFLAHGIYKQEEFFLF